MIKLDRTSLSIIKEEASKGNIYQLLTFKDDVKNEVIFTIITEIIKDKMIYVDYDIKAGLKVVDKGYAPISGWNWQVYDFYMLNKEEAGSYLKEIIANELTQ